MNNPVEIRPYQDSDEEMVLHLFKVVNRLLAPADLKNRFEDYIASSIEEEIGRIRDYYREHEGSFWVAVCGTRLAGMFGLETAGNSAMELRRMYVDPTFRRQGIARQMLHFAEEHCRAQSIGTLELSTSELQPAALSLYHASGYRLIRQDVAETATNKTIGSGIVRSYFSKNLDAQNPPALHHNLNANRP